MHYPQKTYLAVTLLTSALLIGGCGGSGSSSDSDSDTTVASRGVITGFGSVYVNGTRYHTGGTRFDIDDNPGSESDLRVGMIVTVRGTHSNDGTSGRATYIEYDNEIKGPVSAITPDPMDATRVTLTILGQPVEVNANTTIDDDGGLTFATIQVGQVLEVSAFKTEGGLVATHIELQPNDLEIEIKGEVENLVGNNFEINGFAVSFGPATEFEDIPVFRNGIYVEVEGRLDGAGTTLLADEIEAEDESLYDDLDDAEIEGVIYDYNDTAKTFKIQGQAIALEHEILELTAERMLLLDADGSTRFDWRRVP